MYDHQPFYTDDFMANVLGIEALPKNLFHYTSIDTLEKILANRTLRFGRLDQVNDAEEAQASDVALASTSVFVSCWSTAATEQIPLWSIYGGAFHGVRLCMPSNMFAGRHKPVIYEKGGARTHIDSDLHIVRKSPAMSTTSRSIIGPNKVYYTDDAAYLRRPLIARGGTTARHNPYDLGMVKNTKWAYEEEWRFKIAALPFETEFPNDEYFNNVTLDLTTCPVETSHLLVPLDPPVVDELIVTTGPLVSLSEYRRIEVIVANHAPNATVLKSTIMMR